MNVQLPELYRAYRAAKVEAFHDTNCAHGLKFAEFEADLAKNLSQLKRTLNSSKPTWPEDLDFIGEVACIPKSIDATPERGSQNSDIHCQESDPLKQWSRDCANCANGKATVDFRPVINASVAFAVVSALWVYRVGHLYDERLDTRYAVGNRLRRLRPGEDAEPGTSGDLHPFAHGLFNPYFSSYGAWREKGLRIMRQELMAGQRIVAVTMDLKRFYHQVDASFLLDRKYLREIGLSLTGEQKDFTTQLIAAFSTWNAEAHKLFNGGSVGLPVGLTASPVIANVLLQEFDRHLVEELSPAYYARYVDDVFLVLRRDEPFADGAAFVRWLAKRLAPLTAIKEEIGADENNPSIRVELPYAGQSELLFVGKKQKIFQLHGPNGLDLIGPIEQQIREQSSEHRSMPALPASEKAMAHRALLVSSDASLSADALRKADAVTLRRSGFAMLLSDVEAYTRDLTPETWHPLRQEFTRLVARQLRGPKSFFDYSRYLARVVGVMVACGDFADAERFVRGFRAVFGSILETSKADRSVNVREVLPLCRRTLGERLNEAVLQASPRSGHGIGGTLRAIREVFGLPHPHEAKAHSKKAVVRALHNLDWARTSYASAWIDAIEDAKSPHRPALHDTEGVIDFAAIDTFTKLAGLRKPHWPAIAFPTRPIPQREITSRADELINDGAKLNLVVRSLRGSWLPRESSLKYDDGDSTKPPHRIIPWEENPKPKVAITSFEVGDEEWSAAATGKPQLTLARYQRLNRLLDEISRCRPRPNYVLFPECSLPRRWAMPIATKLVTQGISLIAGLEYRTDPTDSKKLHNEVLVALKTNFPGYPTSLCLLQAKECAAWHEGEELRKRGKRLPKYKAKKGRHAVYVHAKLCFGVLICSELTNIRNRALFQGKVDALFIPEWNSDLESFGALVEASALDVHCYVAQANNRKFGDSRMRAPFKKSHLRDVIRLKGGENDYFVIGTIDYMELRRFHSFAVPPMGDNATFKPFPLGFPQCVSKRRKVTPIC